MTLDEKRAHLIERAAARLRDAALPSAITPVAAATAELTSMRPFRQQGPRRSPSNGKERPATIDAGALAKAGALDWDRAGSRIIEELNIAQSKLLRQAQAGNGASAPRSGNLIMITSALEGEGKSFISLNLALGIARQAEREVLLIDTDAKPGSLGQIFGLSTVPGLFDLAREDSLDIDDLVVRTVQENLEFLPAGSAGGGKIGAPSRARMPGLVEQIGRRYSDRLIVIDAPPCLVNSAPHTLAPAVGQTVFVVAAGITQRGDVEAALDLVRACRVVSLLLNKIKPWNAHSFGSYGYPPVQA